MERSCIRRVAGGYDGGIQQAFGLQEVCEERLNTMRKPCSQYLTQGKVSMMRMTARTSEAGREATLYVSGKLCRAYAGTDFHVSFPPHVNMRENRKRRETLFCVFVLLVCELPLTEPPPEASSSVAREYMRPEARA